MGSDMKRAFAMADITRKEEIFRQAVAVGRLKVRPSTINKIRRGEVEKGDPMAAAEIAAALAAKATSQIIPLCHPIPITNMWTKARLHQDAIEVEASVSTSAKTGVEMEALTAATVYLLTIWDMTKQYEKDRSGQYPITAIEYVKVKRKRKGEGR